MALSKRHQFSDEKGICHMSETTITKLPDPSLAGRRLRSNLPRGDKNEQGAGASTILKPTMIRAVDLD